MYKLANSVAKISIQFKKDLLVESIGRYRVLFDALVGPKTVTTMAFDRAIKKQCMYEVSKLATHRFALITLSGPQWLKIEQLPGISDFPELQQSLSDMRTIYPDRFRFLNDEDT